MSLFPFLLGTKPEDKMECFRWVQGISLPVSVQLYKYSCGDYYGNLNSIWEIEATNDDMMMKAVDAVHMMIPTFSTRTMRMEIMQRYSTEIQPSLIKNIFSFITKDSSVAETSQTVDDNITAYHAKFDDPDLLYDLRNLNGRSSGNILDPFWEELKKFHDDKTIVHDRR